MPIFHWKTVLVGAAIVAATGYAVAQMAPGNGPMAQMHRQMMQGQGGPHGGGQGGAMHGQPAGAGVPTLPGLDAFGAIQEVVRILQDDPATDWSKVNIGALRDHLIDMNEVTLHAGAQERVTGTGTGIEIEVTGEGRTAAAIKRMVPAHVRELASQGWYASTSELPNGVRLVVTANDAVSLTKLKALGFIGIMVQGGHHQPHHLMMARANSITKRAR